MQHFSTAGVPQQKKLDFWNGLTSDYLVRMDVVPFEKRNFEAELYSEKLGPLTISKATSSRAEIHRTKFHISLATERIFLINLTELGSFKIKQGGRETILGTRDLALSDSTEPFVYTHNEDCSAIVLTIPEKLLKLYLPYPEELLGTVVHCTHGVGEIIFKMLKGMVKYMQYNISNPFSPSIAYAMLEMLTAAYTDTGNILPSGTRFKKLRREQIRSYIETHLTNPDLTPSNISAYFNISSRYMRMIFVQDGESVSEYINRRRLEESARRLTDPIWINRTISEIAFNWGFNSLNTYERAFKNYFGMSPSKYREKSMLSIQHSKLN